MKLTPAQLRDLKAVARSEVSYTAPLSIKKEGYIDGASKQVIQRLLNMKLIAFPVYTWRTMRGLYTLTDAGRKVLEEKDSI